MSSQAYYEGLIKQFLIMFLPSLLKAGIYHLFFTRGQGLKFYLIFFLAAFVPGIVLMSLPFTIPPFLLLVFQIILVILISSHYADIDVSVKSISIIVAVEVGFYFLLRLVMQSM